MNAPNELDPSERKQLREVIAKREIHDVILRYCRGVDRLDRQLLRSCYHADATDEHGSFTGTADEFVEWCFRVASRYSMAMHFIGNVLIEIEGDDSARAETYGTSYHRTDGAGPEGNLTVGFRYVDRFERREDRLWKIARRICTTEWVRVDDTPNQWPIPEGMRRGQRDRTDAIYEI